MATPNRYTITYENHKPKEIKAERVLPFPDDSELPSLLDLQGVLKDSE